MTDEKKAGQEVSKEELSNRFLYSAAIVKRAKQLREGVRPLVDYDKSQDMRPIEIAIQEIEAEKVGVLIRDEVKVDEEFMEEMEQVMEAELDAQDESDDSDKGKKSKSLAS